MKKSPGQSRLSSLLRFGALMIASIAAGVWLFAMLLQVVVGLQKGQDVLNLEAGLLSALILVNVTGVILGWWRKVAGTRLLLVGGLTLSIFSVFAAGRNRSLAVAISGLPFLLSGALLWFTARSDSNQGAGG
jgi:hypothetical protein